MRVFVETTNYGIRRNYLEIKHWVIQWHDSDRRINNPCCNLGFYQGCAVSKRNIPWWRSSVHTMDSRQYDIQHDMLQGIHFGRDWEYTDKIHLICFQILWQSIKFKSGSQCSILTFLANLLHNAKTQQIIFWSTVKPYDFPQVFFSLDQITDLCHRLWQTQVSEWPLI